MFKNKIQFPNLILFAPLIFVCHFLEELPGFVEWFNAHVARGITPELFWTVNFFGLLIAAAVAGIEWSARSAFSMILAVFWFSFMMLANGIFHVTAGIVDGGYAPGLVTSVLLYFPFYFLLFVKALQSKRVKFIVLLISAVLGSIPMFIHGYLILFRGSRLF